MERIKIDLLSIWNYRNYEALKCRFSPFFNVFTGLNGAGKTSLLDTIYYLSNGKSYFSYRDIYLYRTGTDFFRLEADLYLNDEKSRIEISSSESTPKKIKMEGKQIKNRAVYIGRYPSFMIAPNDIAILLESSVERRKLINRTLSQVDTLYFKYLLIYNKLLKQRNAALKSMNESGRVDALLLETFNNKMIEPSNYIHEKRKIYTEEITPYVNKFYAQLSDDSEKLDVLYKCMLDDESLIELLKQNQRKDIYASRTTVGIHKDDLELKINGQDLKRYASQGQLKSAVIALKLAQLEYVRNISQKIPILLLDDIFDKLDNNRVQNFISICHDHLKAQVFITDTDNNRVIEQLNKLNIEHQGYNIELGKIIE